MQLNDEFVHGQFPFQDRTVLHIEHPNAEAAVLWTVVIKDTDDLGQSVLVHIAEEHMVMNGNARDAGGSGEQGVRIEVKGAVYGPALEILDIRCGSGHQHRIVPLAPEYFPRTHRDLYAAGRGNVVVEWMDLEGSQVGADLYELALHLVIV